MINEVKLKLESLKIPFYEKDGGIAIKIPNGFGELEFHDLPHNDDILLLADEDWHTHSSVMDGLDGIIEVITDILNGKCIFIEVKSPEGVVTKRIEEDLDEYLKWLPEGYTYEVFNKA